MLGEADISFEVVERFIREFEDSVGREFQEDNWDNE